MGSKVTDEGGARKKRRAEFYKVLSKMQKSLVYKPAQVIWCCSSMIVVSLCFPYLYFGSSLAMVVVRQGRFKTFCFCFCKYSSQFPFLLSLLHSNTLLHQPPALGAGPGITH